MPESGGAPGRFTPTALRPFASAPPPLLMPRGAIVRAIDFSPRLSQVTVTVDGGTGTMIFVDYASLPGNLPNTNLNFVAVWEGPIVAWNQAPLRTMRVPIDQESGSLIIDQLQVTTNAYTVGYGVGATVSTICASSMLGAGLQAIATTSVGMSLRWVTSTAVAVHYVTLSGYLPATNKNWIGLWSGEVSPYGQMPSPLARTAVQYDYSEGDLAFNAVKIAAGGTYTFVYFMTALPDTTAPAAILTFTTAGP